MKIILINYYNYLKFLMNNLQLFIVNLHNYPLSVNTLRSERFSYNIILTEIQI